ncbi:MULTISPECIES: substrate-binding domain-containing protein [unclassified Curtobacterium]|uniref:LacI family DNA-binding transcriptional regulator n=1 Tax=unclassified Curtobacterium TaxID=257496 RepID=UPI0008253A0C|nr:MULTISPECIES: substrate-binding domain-containing protein [unclassified Curtobacterium]WIA96043.1 substrate-binding domain-containing protein [Curtobacterium sp. MCBA15_004]WIA99346.1 substrate-binding domain-containing protein [Curtobacterium sp. MCBA15_012]
MTTTTALGSAGGRRRKAPTIFDVAERAGVSHQTVSRVINGDPTVREQFRSQVTDAVTALGYRPRAAARALAGGRSRALGIITAGDALYGPSSTSIGFERAARSAGYHVLLSTLPDAPRPADLSGALTTLLAQDVAAIVLVAADNRVLAALESLTIPVTVPVVVANAVQRDAVRTPVAPSVAAVAIDQAAGTTLVMEHLFGRGHRHVVHVAGPAVSQESEVRRDTYVRIMREAGLTPVVLDGDWTPASGFAAARQIDTAVVDAVFAGNDQMALGVLHAFADDGLRVPDDVAVVGFDDVPEAAHFTPPLTTVRQDFMAMGQRVLESVRALVEGEPRDETLLLPELVVRRSA